MFALKQSISCLPSCHSCIQAFEYIFFVSNYISSLYFFKKGFIVAPVIPLTLKAVVVLCVRMWCLFTHSCIYSIYTARVHNPHSCVLCIYVTLYSYCSTLILQKAVRYLQVPFHMWRRGLLLWASLNFHPHINYRASPKISLI